MGKGSALGKSYTNAFIQVLMSIKETANDSPKKGNATHTWVEQVLKDHVSFIVVILH